MRFRTICDNAHGGSGVFGRNDERRRRDRSGRAETRLDGQSGENRTNETQTLGLLYGRGRRHIRRGDNESGKVFPKQKRVDRRWYRRQKTAAAMGISLSTGNATGSSSGYSSSDEYLLAKCVYAEARGEPYVGQVAVAAVVLNRVKSASFPNTIAGVIYQPWAFTAVNDGQINLSPNATAIKAAKDALNGWDPTNGCLYYYNPSTATSKWIWSRTVMLSIGKHNFAK